MGTSAKLSSTLLKDDNLTKQTIFEHIRKLISDQILILNSS